MYDITIYSEGFGKYPCLANFISFMASYRLKPNSSRSISSFSSFSSMPSICASAKTIPDHVDSTVIESASSTNTDAVPSTKKTERRGTMVAAVKPSDHKVKLQDVVRPPDIKI
jgi:hypothetical protein